MTSRIIWSREYLRCKQGFLSIMVGRKRKNLAQREPNGRAIRSYENPRAQVASQPHRMLVPVEYREREEAESEFGRLMLNGLISPAQYEAGRQYAALIGLFRLVHGIPSPNPRAVDLLQAMTGGAGDFSEEIAKSIRRRYDDAFCACSEAGNAAQRAVNAHAIFDRQVHDWATLPLLRRGLDCLVKHFGVDPAKQIERKRTHRIPQPAA
jgi:hypothetical protein